MHPSALPKNDHDGDLPQQDAAPFLLLSSSSSSKTVLPSLNSDNNSNKDLLLLRIRRSLTTAAASLLLVGHVLTAPSLPASAASYGSLSDEQKIVAEAWRLVDNSFLDRTFNHQDWFAVRQKYVFGQKYRNREEAQDAIRTMVASLGDKYTRYLSPNQYQSLVDSATGTLAGVGIEISQDPATGRIFASDVQDHSPALAAGIRPGDVFVQVDGTDFLPKENAVNTNTPDDVAVRLRGPVKSKVGVVMQRDSTKLDYILERQPITITAVKSYLSPSNKNVGVIRIKNFSGTTAETVAKQMADLQKRGAQQLVLDCRGNPGGLLPGGVDTAALFLPANRPVVFVVNKLGVVDAQSTLSEGVNLEMPVVVLVDGNTASAAEVFAAALQENDRAVLAGADRTFGKGIVQTIRELSDKNGGLAITVARYETPRHNDINKQGISVDVPTPVDCPKDDAALCLKGAASVFRKPTMATTVAAAN